MTICSRESRVGSGTTAAKLVKQVRDDLDWIVMQCLEKEPARRYQAVNELIADIDRYLRHEPVLARPPSFAYTVRKLARRNRIAFASPCRTDIRTLHHCLRGRHDDPSAADCHRARSGGARETTSAEGLERHAERLRHRRSISELRERCQRVRTSRSSGEKHRARVARPASPHALDCCKHWAAHTSEEANSSPRSTTSERQCAYSAERQAPK